MEKLILPVTISQSVTRAWWWMLVDIVKLDPTMLSALLLVSQAGLLLEKQCLVRQEQYKEDVKQEEERRQIRKQLSGPLRH